MNDLSLGARAALLCALLTSLAPAHAEQYDIGVLGSNGFVTTHLFPRSGLNTFSQPFSDTFLFTLEQPAAVHASVLFSSSDFRTRGSADFGDLRGGVAPLVPGDSRNFTFADLAADTTYSITVTGFTQGTFGVARYRFALGIDAVRPSGEGNVVTVAEVPEPSTYALMFAGLLMLGFVKRRFGPSSAAGLRHGSAALP